MIQKLLHPGLASGLGLILCLTICFSPTTSLGAESVNQTDSDCQKAISIAEKALPPLKLNPASYKLIEVKNLIVKGPDYKGPHLWRVTFKLKKLIPKSADKPIGAGGEVFILVDLKAQSTTVKYGE